MSDGTDPGERSWLFVVRAEDRPGSAASIAATFSGRGIQIESFFGFGDLRAVEHGPEAVVGITFLAFRHRMESVRRVLERLEAVRSVRVFDYRADPRLAKVLLLRVAAAADRAAAVAGADGAIGVQVLEQAAGASALLLSGRPADVDAALERLRRTATVTLTIATLLPPDEA